MQFSHKIDSPWEIVGQTRRTLRLGDRLLPLDQIRDARKSAHEERDFLPSFLNAVIYLTVAAMFVVLVVHGASRPRFLLVTVFFTAVALSSLIDVVAAHRIRLYRLVLVTTDGRWVTFTSPDPAEVDRLALAVKAATGS